MSLTLLVDGHAVWLPALVALGIGVGVVAGMFGVGGGFLLVPLLHAVLGVPLPVAVGAGLFITIANGLGSFLRYRRMGHAEHRFAILLLGGSLLGADAGTRILASLDGHGAVVIAGKTLEVLPVALTAAYTLVFGLIAALLWLKPPPSLDEHLLGPGPLARVRIPPLIDLPMVGVNNVSGPVTGYVGFANGVLAGLLGIGGGICLIPIMLYGYGFSVKKAAGTGSVVVLMVSLLGTAQHARLGHVHLGLSITLMLGSALAAQVGASLTRSLPASTLRKALAVILVLTPGALLFRLLG